MERGVGRWLSRCARRLSSAGGVSGNRGRLAWRRLCRGLCRGRCSAGRGCRVASSFWAEGRRWLGEASGEVGGGRGRTSGMVALAFAWLCRCGRVVVLLHCRAGKEREGDRRHCVGGKGRRRQVGEARGEAGFARCGRALGKDDAGFVQPCSEIHGEEWCGQLGDDDF